MHFQCGFVGQSSHTPFWLPGSTLEESAKSWNHEVIDLRK